MDDCRIVKRGAEPMQPASSPDLPGSSSDMQLRLYHAHLYNLLRNIRDKFARTVLRMMVGGIPQSFDAEAGVEDSPKVDLNSIEI